MARIHNIFTLRKGAPVIIICYMVVSKLYNQLVDAALNRHFPHETGYGRSLTRASVMDKLLKVPEQEYMRRALDPNETRHAQGFFDACGKYFSSADRRHGQPHYLEMTETERERFSRELPPELLARFEAMHARDPSRFEAFLGELVDGIVCKDAEWHRANEAELAGSASPLGARLLRGSAVLAGVGLIGHGTYKAASAVETDEHGQTRRNWAKTVGHVAEAAAGAGITWVSVMRGNPVVTTLQR